MSKFKSKEDALQHYKVAEVIQGVNVYVENNISFGQIDNTPYRKHTGTLSSFLSSNEVCYFNREGAPTLFKGYDMYGNLLIHTM